MLAVSGCGKGKVPSAKYSKRTIVWDLTRNTGTAECDHTRWNPSVDLAYHWKMNPARYVSTQKPWQYSQITILTESEGLVNESKDSILLGPGGSKCRFQSTQAINGKLHFSLTALPLVEDTLAVGELRILRGKELLLKKDLKFQNQWIPMEILAELPENGNLTFRWNSSNSYAVIGSPFIYQTKRTDRKNVILIVVDALRNSSLGLGGNPFGTSPFMDQLAKESIQFSKTFSNGNWTKPSMLSFFTSRYSSDLGLDNQYFSIGKSAKATFYPEAKDNLVNRFRSNGYLTESVMNNVFLLDYTTVGVDLGFHELYQSGKDRIDTTNITNKSLDFLENHKDDLFFLHINLNTPHWPYNAPYRYLQELYRKNPNAEWNSLAPEVKRYYAEVLYTDGQIQQIVQKLKDLKLYDDSWIVITSDHGELLDTRHFNHGQFIAKIPFAHGETLYDEELHVPWIIKVPGSLKGNVKRWKFTSQVSLLSLAPTILGLNGLEVPRSMQGNDYSESIWGRSQRTGENVVYSEGRRSESIRTKNFKYIRRYPGFTNIFKGDSGESVLMPEEYYDLKADPQEFHNLVFQYPKKIIHARKILRDHSLQKNTFWVRLPADGKKNEWNLSFYARGEVYNADILPNTGEINASKNLLTYRSSTKEDIILKIQTTKPDTRFSLSVYKNGQLQPLRVGAWGLVNPQKEVAQSELVIQTTSPPFLWNTTKIPFIYNDSAFSGSFEETKTEIMGEEVRKVLEDWGYIHE